MITKLSSILMPPFYLHGFSSCVYCLRHENGWITAHLALNTNRRISTNPEITLQNYRKQLDIYRGGSRGGGGAPRPAPPLKLGKIWFFGVKSWFFTRNTPKIFSPPTVRRNLFKCAPPNLKSWIRPWFMSLLYILLIEILKHCISEIIVKLRVTSLCINTMSPM